MRRPDFQWLAAAAITLVFTGSATAALSPFCQDTLDFPDDPFAVQSTEAQPGWIKFLVLTADPATVYFQDSVAYSFHYDFAVNELAQFAGMTPTQFNAVTLYESGRQALLGAVVLPPLVDGQATTQEYGIQFVGTEPIDPVLVRDTFQQVVSATVAPPQVRPFYFPTFEQLESALANEAFFFSSGIRISSADRWAAANSCYSLGWAVGMLKYIPGDQIADAYLSGTLQADDVLLTDTVPSEIPYVSGIVSLSAATPNSHVAILAQTFGSPFVHLALAEDAQRAQAFVGKRVALRAVDGLTPCEIRLADVDDVDAVAIAELQALKTPPDLNIDPIQILGNYSSPTTGLNPSDIQHFGGKASNYGILRRSIPANSPVALALSFDLWSEFLDQTLPGGGTLRQEIDQLLAPYDTYPPADIRALSETLAEIRNVVETDTIFTPQQESGVIAALQDPQYGFDSLQKLRFRSSTNVEDSEQFTGAGLYDSKSGCLADDLDGDTIGPGQCDPTENNEKGVFRAIRKVFASFYNDNAFLERLRHGVDEDLVGMALLVHHSFPDPLELANGVATLEQNVTGQRVVYLVTQDGDSSVTNPEPGAIPEEVAVLIDDQGTITPSVVEYSNLVPMGQTVMQFPQAYIDLTELLLSAADEYEQVTQKPTYKLEFEYKRVAPGGGALPPGGLAVKQIRPIPQPGDDPVTPFLVNLPLTRCLFQGAAAGNPHGRHRLKSRWTLETRNMWLTESNLQEGLFTNSTFRYAEGCLEFERNGPPSSWPQPTHTFVGGESITGWTADELQNPRNYTLRVPGIPTSVSAADTPLWFLDEAIPRMWLEATYANPAGPDGATFDQVRLGLCPEDQEDGPLEQRSISEAGVSIATEFYWPPPPKLSAGYTAPLVRFVQTTISGLTTDPIVLQSEFSQTYNPSHHNFTEYFVFEPGLDPAVTQAQLDELETASYRAFYIQVGFGGDVYVSYDDASWGNTCLDCTDTDGDGRCLEAPIFDCSDSDPTVWAAPGEARGISFTAADTFDWSEPWEKGGESILYDTIRSTSVDDFAAGAVCDETGGPDTTTTASTVPASGELHLYLVRAVNDCPIGEGSLGRSSQGQERSAAPCP